MKAAIEDLVRRREPETLEDYDRALREAIQVVALLGLWRAKFFEHAAFYGGTALRVVHGLPRFSEDIDFSLLEKNESFSLEGYVSAIRNELSAYGLESSVDRRGTSGGRIESAFIRANTKRHILEVALAPGLAQQIPGNQLLKVKLEVDITPPGGFATEAGIVLEPLPFHVRIYVPEDLFAGKMHSVLCRHWETRVKGRDWYDMVWFLQRNTALHLGHLESRMRQSGHWTSSESIDEGVFHRLYEEKVQQTDFTRAARDVMPFIADPRELDGWERDMFLSLSSRFRFV